MAAEQDVRPGLVLAVERGHAKLLLLRREGLGQKPPSSAGSRRSREQALSSPDVVGALDLVSKYQFSGKRQEGGPEGGFEIFINSQEPSLSKHLKFSRLLST